MKIILSRKGFDSANGGMPSPIMPDGTLLSMPIPSDDNVLYDELTYEGHSYSEILHQLAPRKKFGQCHVDPDIRKNCRLKSVPNWTPAFGQIGAAQGVLSNANVEVGDIFLFFGWFRKAELHDGKYRFVRRNTGDFYDCSDIHVIYGYLQIGRIISDKSLISGFPWHPHSSAGRLENSSNTLYLPSETLSIVPGLDGYGTLDYRDDRVLTMRGKSRATWDDLPFLLPEHIYGQRKNGAKGAGLYYGGIWQELVINESEGLIDWAKSIIQ
ncbi:MAG: hypothetical protein IK064_04005 [Clostridia bacterium]|nr:hypothetical protein [Clostridia bacterium]